jgi:hypothetical protein
MKLDQVNDCIKFCLEKLRHRTTDKDIYSKLIGFEGKHISHVNIKKCRDFLDIMKHVTVDSSNMVFAAVCK